MAIDYEAYQGKKVLITGGLGFIGSNLAIRLVELGANLTLVDSMIPDYGGNLFNIHPVRDRVNVNFSDVRDEHSMDFLVRNQDFLFNLAGQVSHIDSMGDPYTDLEINVRSQISILEACRKNNPNIRIVLTSTRQVYGRPDHLPVKESHPLLPTDVNGINKMAGEWYHLLYHKVFGIRSVALRLTNTYGPRQLVKHNRQGFIPWFIRQAVREEEIKIYGDGNQLRDVNYVDDVVSALIGAGVSPTAYGEIFNLGSNPVSLLDLVRMIIEVNGKGNYQFVAFPPEKKKIDIGSVYADYGKIRDQLGWNPEIDLRNGLERTISYYKEYGNQYWE